MKSDHNKFKKKIKLIITIIIIIKIKCSTVRIRNHIQITKNALNANIFSYAILGVDVRSSVDEESHYLRATIGSSCYHQRIHLGKTATH